MVEIGFGMLGALVLFVFFFKCFTDWSISKREITLSRRRER